MTKRFNTLLRVCFLLISIVIIGCMSTKPVIHPENFPERPITLIVPFSAGGSIDLVMRSMEKIAKKHLGQPLIIKNIPGGGSTIGWNELAGANPDGYTIGATSNNIILQPLYSSTKFHYPTALDPLVQVTTAPIVAVVLSERPWRNVDELVKYAKEHPGEIRYGHQGIGVPSHVVAEIFAKEAGITIAQVPFNGGSETLATLLGEHIELIFITTAVVKDYVKDGKLRVLAVATDQRLADPLFANVPTFKEQGFNVEFSHWFGIGAPKGLPDKVKSKLSEGLTSMIHDPVFLKNMDELGLVVDYLGPQECCEKWIAESIHLKKVIKELDIDDLISSQKN